MKINIQLISFSMTLFLGFDGIVKAQECLTGGCSNFGNEYPSSGAPYTPPGSWQVLINPNTGNDALMNGGNWTRFSVTSGNTYEWTMCATYGGDPSGWDAQFTLYNYSSGVVLCYSDDQCGTAPYISWTATFTGTVRLLTSQFTCASNSGTPYNKIAYRQISVGCTTPGTPATASGTATGQTTANFSWSAGSPIGSPTVTYYWVVGTSSSVTWGNGVDQGSTTGTSATTSSLTCNTTYYMRVYAYTSCNGTTSGYKTSSSFTTSPCSGSLNGVDIYAGNGTVNWHQVYLAGKSFAYVKATKGVYNGLSCAGGGTGYTDGLFVNNMTSANPDGVVLGAYHFALPEDHTALDEANYFLSVAGSYIGTGYLPPVLDLEDPAGTCIINSQPLTTYYSGNMIALAQWVNAWATRVHTVTNVWPVLYGDRCNVAAPLYPYYQNGTINSNIKLWIADYSHPPGSPGNASGCNWTGWPWVFHQYFAPSAAGNNPTTYADPGMDQDIFYGSIVDFNNLIGTGSSTPDLTITAGTQSVSSTSVCAGSSITAYCSEDNNGTAVSGSNVVALWLTTNATLTACSPDVYLGNISGFPSLSAGSNSLVLNNTITIPSNTLSGTYYLWFWADGCSSCGCTGVVTESTETNNFASVQITVTGLPNSTTVNGSGTFCNSATIIASGGGGGTICWQGTTSNGTSTATPSTSQNVTSSGTYYFRAYNSCGWGTQGSATVTINSTPASTTVSGGGTFCNSTTLTASGGSGGTIYWQGTTSNGTSTATPSTSQNVTSSGTYYFRSNNSCGWGTQGSATVTINTSPAATTVSGGGTFCNNATLTASGGSGGTIYWQGTTSNGTSTATPSTSQNVTSSGTYYFRANNNCGWGTQGSTTVTINSTPAAVTVSGGGTFCNSATITASGGNGGTIYFQGTIGGGTLTGAPSTVQTVTSSGTYYFRANNACGWGIEGSVTVTIIDIDTTVTVNGITLISNENVGSYQWLDCNNGNYQIIGETNQTYTASQNGNFAVQITLNGCVDTSNCYMITGVGIKQLNETNNFYIYPNPTNDFVNIKGEGLYNGNLVVILINTLGKELNKKVIKVSNNSIELRLSMKELPSGIYFLNFESEQSNQTFKIQKQ